MPRRQNRGIFVPAGAPTGCVPGHREFASQARFRFRLCPWPRGLSSGRLTNYRSGYVIVRLTNNRSRYVIVRLTYFRTALSRIRYGEFNYLRYPDLRLQGFGRICD